MNRRVFGILTALFLVSCRAPMSWNDGAVLSIAVEGVVPMTTRTAATGGSRLILSQTANVRLSATVAGSKKESLTAYSGPGTQASLGGLPQGTPLEIRAETLDAQGLVLTSWTDTVTLTDGPNAVAARLLPEASSVAPGGSDLASLAAINLAAGSASFYEIAFSATDAPNLINEYQLIANTGSFRSLWLEAYDADWNQLPAIAVDSDHGWKVIRVPQGGGIVRVAVAAPDGARTATLQARAALFFATAAQGGATINAGTSASPKINFQDNLDGGRSLFVKAGSYVGSATWTTDTHVYGGFSATDWSLRDPSLYETLFTASGADTAIDVSGTASGYLDGMTVKARSYPGMGLPGGRGLNLVTMGKFVVGDCRLLGPEIGGAVGQPSKALSIEGGTPEIVDCYIDGGDGAADPGITGIFVAVGRPLILGCSINGGHSHSSGNSISTAIFISSGSAIISGCSVFGGVAATTMTSGAAANSFGIVVPVAPSAQVVIANSIISGGYAKGASSSLGFSYGIYSYNTSASNYPIIVNCVIDAGTSIQPSSPAPFAALYSADAAGYILASGNVFIVSGTLTGGLVVRVGATNFLRFAGNSAFGPFGGSIGYRVGSTGASLWDFASLPNYPENSTYTSTEYSNNTTYRTAPTRTDVFTAYNMGKLTGSATDFSYWLSDNDWRPKSGAAAYFTGAYNPVSSGDIPVADVAAYPELLLDRGGNPRPVTGMWTRGAYQ